MGSRAELIAELMEAILTSLVECQQAESEFIRKKHHYEATSFKLYVSLISAQLEKEPSKEG